MTSRTELLPLTTAAVIAAAVVQGGAFAPQARCVVGMLFAVVAAWSVISWRGRMAVEEWLGLAVVGWAALAALVVGTHYLAAKEMLTGWLVAWIVFVVARRARQRRREEMVGLLVAAAVVVALAVIAESLAAGMGRMGGLLVNPNVAAALMVPALPTAWMLWTRGRRGWIGAASALLIVGVLATGSRAGVIGMVVVIWFILPRTRVRISATLIAAAAGIALLWWRFVQSPDSLAWHRFEIWQALWNLTTQHPLMGVGPGWLEEATGVVRIAHAESIARYRHIIGSAESVPVGLLVRTGLVGFAIAVAAVAAWLRGVVARGCLGARWVMSTLAALAVFGLFHDIWDQDIVLWWWAVVAGLTVPKASEDQLSWRQGRRAGFLVRMAAALCVAGFVLWGIVQPAYARHVWWGSPSSVELAKRAVRAEPWFSEPARWRSRNLLTREQWTWEDGAEALAWSRRAVRSRRGSHSAWSEYGLVNARIVEQLGAWPDAIEEARNGFQRATALEPHLPWHWLRWGQFERGLGQMDEARRLARRAVGEEPRFVRGWLLLARVELDMNRPVEARTALGRAVEARHLADWRSLSPYESDLTKMPPWQVNELSRELEQGAGLTTRSADGAGGPVPP